MYRRQTGRNGCLMNSKRAAVWPERCAKGTKGAARGGQHSEHPAQQSVTGLTCDLSLQSPALLLIKPTSQPHPASRPVQEGCHTAQQHCAVPGAARAASDFEPGGPRAEGQAGSHQWPGTWERRGDMEPVQLARLVLWTAVLWGELSQQASQLDRLSAVTRCEAWTWQLCSPRTLPVNYQP